MKLSLNLYDPSSIVIVRNPLFSVENLLKYYKNEITIYEFYKNENALKALLIASPELFDNLNSVLNGNIVDKEKIKKIELSLLKYLIRMTFRSTPFGLFASCSPGKLSDYSHFVIGDENSLLIHARIDMDFAIRVYDELLKDDELLKMLKFQTNTSLYKLNGKYRYVESKTEESKQNFYNLVEVNATDYLDQIIEISAKGISYIDLLQSLKSLGFEEHKAEVYIKTLINSQILISELAPNLTGEDYIDVVIQKLDELEYSSKLVDTLKIENKKFKNVNRLTPLNDLSDILNSNLAKSLNVSRKKIVQIDTSRGTLSNLINSSISDEILRCYDVLKNCPETRNRNDQFQLFKSNFMEKYERQFVPLLEVLDTESGIGFEPFFSQTPMKSFLLEDLPFSSNSQNMNSSFINFDRFKYELYESCLKNKLTEIDLTSEELKQTISEVNNSSLPNSLQCLVHVVAKSENAIDNGEFKIVLKGFSGPNAIVLQSRFSYLDNQIESEIDKIIGFEDRIDTNVIYAEIVHIPESRVGNILRRKHFRMNEILYLSNSTLPYENKITLDDILIGVRENRVILWSKKRNKQIIPRLSNAHNYNSTKLVVYKFLCELQYQNIDSIGWSWGNLETRQFLPRITIGKCIVYKARWIVYKQNIISSSDEEISVKKLSDRLLYLEVPEFIIYSHGDNELLLNLRNESCLMILKNEINKFGIIKLIEYIEDEFRFIQSESNKPFNSELVFSFTKNFALNKATNLDLRVNIENNSINHIDRKLLPGENCLYFKVFCGYKISDQILSKVLYPFSENLLSLGKIDKYFFIRYNTGGNHIRLRLFNFSGIDSTFIVSELNLLLRQYVENRSVANIQIDTYQREIERYDKNNIEDTETLFYINSRSVLNVLAYSETEIKYDDRWRIALKVMDMIFDFFEFSIEVKKEFTKKRQNSFFKSNMLNANQRKQYSNKFHKLRNQIEDDIKLKNDNDLNFVSIIEFFQSNLKGAKNNIYNIKSNCINNDDLNNWIGDYIHMFINRLFTTNQNIHEVVLYDFLTRYYEFEIGKSYYFIEQNNGQ